MEEVCSVRNLDRGPVFDGPFAGHVTAWIEHVTQWPRINVKTRLQSHTQLGNSPNGQTNRTRPMVGLICCAPIVVALDMAALQVDVGLLAAATLLACPTTSAVMLVNAMVIPVR